MRHEYNANTIRIDKGRREMEYTNSYINVSIRLNGTE